MSKERDLETLKLDVQLLEQATEAKIAEKSAGKTRPYVDETRACTNDVAHLMQGNICLGRGKTFFSWTFCWRFGSACMALC